MSDFLKRLLDTETSKTLFGEDRIKATKKVFTSNRDNKEWTCTYCDSKNPREEFVCVVQANRINYYMARVTMGIAGKERKISMG